MRPGVAIYSHPNPHGRAGSRPHVSQARREQRITNTHAHTHTHTHARTHTDAPSGEFSTVTPDPRSSMAHHFSRRSLSDVLTLERSERGALVIANIDDVDGANQELREGDEVVGATIKFDQLSKEEVMGVLKLMETYDDRVQVLTKNNLSKSMGNLDQFGVSPETMLHDSYNKLYNAKIKRFMRKDMSDGDSLRDFVQTLPRTGQVKTKQDSDLPRLGVDFGRLSPGRLVRRFSADSEASHSAYAPGAWAQEANLNLPPNRRVQASSHSRSVNASLERANAGPGSGIYPNGDDVDATMVLEGTDRKFQMYNLSNGDAEFDLEGYDVSPTTHMAEPSLRLHAPQLDLNGRSGGLGLQESALDLAGPSGDFDVKAPRVRGDFSGLNAHLQGGGVPVPAVRSKVPSGKYKAPKFSMPKFGLPTVEVPDFDEDLDISSQDLKLSKPNIKGLETADWSVKSPKIDGDFDGPNLDLKAPRLDMNAPNMPKVKMPKFSRPSLKGPEIDGRLDGLDMVIDEPKFKLNGPNADLGMPDVDIDGKFISPNMNMPDYDLSSPNLDFSGPNLRSGVSGPDFKTPKLGFKAPKLDLKGPDLDLPSGKLNMPELHGPGLNLKAPKLKGGIYGPDWDTNLRAPKLKGGIDGPDWDANLRAPKLDLSSPDVDLPNAKVNMPKFKVPKFGRPSLKGPDLDADLDGLDMDMNAPKLKLKGPNANVGMPDYDLNGPDLGFKSPDLDFSGPNLGGGLNAPNVKTPKFGLKTPTLDLKSSNLDLPDVHAPNLNLKAAKLKGGIHGPDLDLPNADLKAPKLDMKTPEVNIGSPKTKFKFPKLKMPKFKRPSLKGPDLDADFDGLDMDINAPKVKVKGPKADLGMPGIDIDGKFQKPNMSMPDLDLNGPTIDGPNLDLKSPNLDLNGPNLHGGVNAPNLKMPKLNFRSPKLDLKGPNLDLLDLNGPDLNMKAPKIKGGLKTPTLDINSPNLDLPDLQGPNLNLKAPKIKGGLNGLDWDLPKADLKGPKVDLKSPDINMGSPKAKLKMPKLKMPKLGHPSLKGPDIDADLDSIDMGINAPTLKLDGPNADLDIDGKFKKPNLNMPNFDLKGPDLDLKSLNLDPNLRGGINAPDLKMPKLNFKSPKLDLKGPNLDLPDLNGPNLNVKAPKIKGGIDGPDLNLPNANLKAPKLDLKTPDLNIGSPKAKFKFPKLKMPKLRRPSLKGPDLDVDLDAPDLDINTPNVKLKGEKPNLDIDVGGKLNKPNLNMPKLDLKSPKLDLNAPKLDLDAPDLDVRAPDLNLKAPKLKGGLDVNGPNVNIGSPKAKMKMPKVKLPKVNLPTLNAPDIDGPDFDIDMPDVDIGRPSGKYRKPHLKVPDVELSGPNVRSPKYHGKVKGPNLDVNNKVPKVKGSWDTPKADLPHMDVKAPRMDWDAPEAKYNKPHVKMPKGYEVDLNGGAQGPNLSFPDVRGPNLKPTMPYLDMDDIDLNGPDVSLSGTNAKLRTPDLDVDQPSLKFRKSLHGGSGVPLPGLDLDQNLTHPGVDWRSSTDADLGRFVDFTHSDLNIDDFTGKEHVHRGRGSDLDYQLPSTSAGVTSDLRASRFSGATLNADSILYPSHAVKTAHTLSDGRWSYSQPRAPDTSDAYLVTAFPTQEGSRDEPRQKYGALGGLNFSSSDINLEVPDHDMLKSSTFLISNLV